MTDITDAEWRAAAQLQPGYATYPEYVRAQRNPQPARPWRPRQYAAVEPIPRKPERDPAADDPWAGIPASVPDLAARTLPDPWADIAVPNPPNRALPPATTEVLSVIAAALAANPPAPPTQEHIRQASQALDQQAARTDQQLHHMDRLLALSRRWLPTRRNG